MKEPLVLGGQGRTPTSIRSDSSGIVLSLLAFILLIVLLVIS